MKINKAVLSMLLPVLMIQHVVAAPKKSKIPTRVANITRKLRLNTLVIKKFIRQYKKPLMFSGVGVCGLAVGYLAYNKYYGQGASGVEKKPKIAISTKIKQSRLNPKNWVKKTDNTSEEINDDSLSQEANDDLQDNDPIDSGLEPDQVNQEKRSLFQKGKDFWKGKKIIRNKDNPENPEADSTEE